MSLLKKILILTLIFSANFCFGLTKKEERKIISRAKKNLTRITESHPPLPFTVTPRWDYYLVTSRKSISSFKKLRELIDYAQTAGGFDHRGAGRESLEHIKILENAIYHEFPQFSSFIPGFSESSYSLPNSLVEYNGRLVSNVFYWHLRHVFQSLSYIEKPRIICEIGGGYGNPAFLWMKNPLFNPDVYIMVDFPECLFFAQVFLTANFPTFNIRYIDEVTPTELSNCQFSNKTILLCPASHAHLLKNSPIDLVINTGSMGEMEEDAVEYWMKWLDESQARYFYSLNFFGEPFTASKNWGNTYCPRLSPSWNCLLKKQTPPFVRLQSSMQLAEILAQRMDNESFIDKESLKNRFYSLVNNHLYLQELLDCMDIIRLYPEPNMIWSLLCQVFTMDPMPLESRYVAKFLKKVADDSFFSDKREKFDQFEASLDEWYSHLNKNIW